MRLPSADFESAASTSSTIPACRFSNSHAYPQKSSPFAIRAGQEHYKLLPKSNFSRKESSQPAFRSFLGLLSHVVPFLQMFSAKRRNIPIFSGASPRRMRFLSSPKVTSNTQCSWFSTNRCCLMEDSARSGFKGNELMKYLISFDVLLSVERSFFTLSTVLGDAVADTNVSRSKKVLPFTAKKSA